MKIGTSVHALTEWASPVKPFRQVVAEAAELGFASLMLMNTPGQDALTADHDPPGALVDLEASDLGLVKQVVGDAGLEVACVYQGLMRVGDEAERAATVAGLQRLAEMAMFLETNVVLPNAGAAPRAQMPAAEKTELVAAVAAVVSEALGAFPPGLKIAPDIHYGGLLETVADCERYFALCPDPRAGITLNIGHMTTLGEPGWRLIEEHPDRVHVIAWKDHLVPPPPGATHPVYSVELGTGQSPFARYVQAAKPLDHGQWLHLITFEHVPLADKKAALGRSRGYLERLWEAG